MAIEKSLTKLVLNYKEQTMTKMADFYRDSQDLYYKYKHRHQTDDWEQEYFDAMSVRYDTEEEMCLIHLYYWDDEDIGSVAQSILDDLQDKQLVLSNCFDDEENSTTVVVTIVEKNKGV